MYPAMFAGKLDTTSISVTAGIVQATNISISVAFCLYQAVSRVAGVDVLFVKSVGVNESCGDIPKAHSSIAPCTSVDANPVAVLS